MKVQTAPNKDVQKEITDLSEVRMVAVLCLPKVNGTLIASTRWWQFSFLVLSEQPCVLWVLQQAPHAWGCRAVGEEGSLLGAAS